MAVECHPIESRLPPHSRFDESRAVLCHGRIDVTARVAVCATFTVYTILKPTLVKKMCFNPQCIGTTNDPANLAAVVGRHGAAREEEVRAVTIGLGCGNNKGLVSLHKRLRLVARLGA